MSCDAPVSPVANAEYIIWRSAEAVDTVSAVDGKIEFVDTSVGVGTYSYFVQSYDAVSGVSYNCSLSASIDVTIDLAPVSNVRFTGGRKGRYTDPQTGSSGDCYFITVAWDAPVTPFTVVGYNIYEQGYALATEELDGGVCSVEIPTVETDEYVFRIDVVYEWGVATGEYVTLNFDSSVDVVAERVVTKLEKYGDSMGTTLGLTETVYYLYDVDNMLSRSINIGYETDGTPVPTYEYFYNNNGGNLTAYYYLQYSYLGVWSDAKEYTVYTYDDEGRLVLKDNQGFKERYEYTYDEVGNLLTETKSRVSYGSTEYKVASVKTYSDFDAAVLNKPGKMTATGQYDSDNYVETYEYDGENRLVKAESFYSSNDAPKERREYVYDNSGVEVSAVTSKGSGTEFVYSSRSVREYIGDNRYKVYSDTYSNGTWRSSSRYSIETYTDIRSTAAPLNIAVTDVSTADSPNSVRIECELPQAPVGDAAYVVFRGWQAIDTVRAENGVISYVDGNVLNGTYEYLVQAVDMSTGLGYNCSAPVSIEVETLLAPVSNVRQVSVEEGTYKDAQTGSFPVYWISFVWDAPESVYPVLEYRIYQDGAQVPVSVTTNLNDSVWIYRETDYPEDQQEDTEIAVSAVYEVGESECVVAVLSISVDGVKFAKLSDVYVAGNFLHVGENARVSVYNSAGVMVSGCENWTLIDLTSLPTGVYVARVEKNGMVQVVKIAR